MTGKFGEKIKTKIGTGHFREKEVELDIYLDLDNDGLLKIKKVGDTEDMLRTVQINGINKCPQLTNGWIPHFDFYGGNDNGEEVQIATIDWTCYGKALDLEW